MSNIILMGMPITFLWTWLAIVANMLSGRKPTPVHIHDSVAHLHDCCNTLAQPPRHTCTIAVTHLRL